MIDKRCASCINDISFEPKEVYDYENGYLILFDTGLEKDSSLAEDNVYFISFDGSIVWRIESYYTYSEGRTSIRYFNLRFIEGSPDTFIATTFTGKRIVVDIHSGKIVDELNPHK